MSRELPVRKRHSRGQAFSTLSRRGLLLLGSGIASAAVGGFGLKRLAERREPRRNKAFESRYPFLRGINYTGMSYHPGQQWPVKAALAYYVGAKKMNVIRMPLSWELMQPILLGDIAPDQIVGINELVDEITGAGAYIIIDAHTYGRRTVNGKSLIIGETPALTVEHFANLWRRIAHRWGSNPRVIFNVMNEPHDQNDQILLEVTNVAIAAIRDAGAKGLIMINGNGWNSGGWRPGAPNYVIIGPGIVDPADNFCFDIHHYFDEGGAGQSEACLSNTWQRSVKYFTDWASANGKRAFCGEFAVGIGPKCKDEVTDFLTYLEDHKDVWMGWACWGGGGWWQYDYVFRADPYANPYDKAYSPAERERAKVWAEPLIDMPQMDYLQPFLPGAAPFNGRPS